MATSNYGEQALPYVMWLTMFALCVGEGVGWLATGLLALCYASSRPRWTDWPRALAGPATMGLISAVCRLLPAILPHTESGAVACARLGPCLLGPLVAAVATRIGADRTCRVLDGLVIGALLASCFGLASMAFNVGWGEGFVRLDSSTFGQGRVPAAASRVVGGFYFHRLKFAHALMMVVCVAVVRAWDATSRWQKLQRWAGVLLLGVALFLTYARAGLLACVFGSGVMVFVRGLRARVLPTVKKEARARLLGATVIVLSLMAVAAGSFPAATARLVTTSSPEARAVRAVIWAQAVHIIDEHPLGIGLGRYPQVVAKVFAERDPLSQSPRTYPHSMPLAMWAEGGPVGLLAFFVGFILLFRGAYQATHASLPRHSIQAGWAAMGVLTALAFVGLSHDLFFHQIVAMLAYATIGLLGSQWQHRTS